MATKKPAKKPARKPSTDYPTKVKDSRKNPATKNMKPAVGYKRDNVKTSKLSPMSFDGKSYKYKGAGSEYANKSIFNRYKGVGAVVDKYGNETSASPAMMRYLRKNASPYVEKPDKKKKSK